jgi:iron complex outermembrane recepter protein
MSRHCLARACARRSPICLAVLSVLGMSDVAAQTAAPETLEEVVVTSTGTNISGVAPVGSETVTIGREELVSLGASNLAEVVRSLPQVQNLGFDESARAGGANPTRGTSVNLRGIGQNATLVLVDGHRLTPAGTSVSFTEAMQLPIAAIERVEVIADGASAVYGSDAVSGVVNYVLRKEFDGVEASARYGTNHYGENWSASLLGGTSWEGFGPLGRGSVIASYERYEQAAVLRGELPWYRQDLHPFGGVDNRVAQATATAAGTGNIRVPSATRNPVFPAAGFFNLYGLPTGTNGQGLTFSDLLLNQPNLKDRADYEDYLPETTRDHATLFFNQEVTSWLSAYYQGFYTKREAFSRSFITQAIDSVTFTVPATLLQPDGSRVPNPNYISGIPGVAPDAPLTVQYNLADHIPAGYQQGTSNDEETFSHTAGLRARLPGQWNADFYTTYGTVENCGVCNFATQVNFGPTDAFQRAINEGFINPLSSARLTQAQWDRVRGDNIQSTQNRLVDTVLKFDGPLFKLPAGQVRMAIGGEYTTHNNKLQNGSIRAPSFLGQTAAYGASDVFMWDAQVDVTRYQHAAFTELYVPVVAPEQAVPLVRSLNLSAAGRYDSFSDVGHTTNPKLGLTWQVIDEFSLRGSWGKSFRAPGLPEGNNGLFSATLLQPVFPNNSGDPGIATVAPGFSTLVFRVGGNPEVKPEKGKTWSLGFDWEPNFVEGFSVGGTYYSIAYNSRIIGLPVAQMLANPSNRQIYSQYIIPTPAPAGCTPNDRSTWNPSLRDAYENPAIPGFGRSFLYGNDTFLANNPCNVAVILDARNTNAAATLQHGIDWQLNYSFGALGSSWNLGLYASKILKNEQTLVAGLPTENILDRISFPTSLNARGNINWARGEWSASLFANFVDGYKNDLPISIAGVVQPFSDVPSWTTFDVNLGYAVAPGTGSYLGGVRLNANVRNVLDRDPPVVLSSPLPPNAQDARNHDPFGRTFQFTLTKKF